MQVGTRRLSAVTVLVGVVMLLVPAMAWMQYQWVGQLSQAERERMGRTLRTAASQFAVEFDTELSKARDALQVEGPVLRDENWNSYAQRYSAWIDGASEPKLVRDVLLVDSIPGTALPSVPPPPPPPPPPPMAGAQQSPSAIFQTTIPEPVLRGLKPEQLRVRRWNPSTLAFEPMEWTPDLLAFRESLATHFVGFQIERSGRGPERFRRESSLGFNTGDDNTLVSPVTLVEAPPDRQGPPKVTVLGFTLVRLDPTVVHDTLLASLTARHFHGDDREVDYRVAVVARDDPAHVIWESESGAAKTIGPAPDVSQDFMSPRPDQLFVIARNPGTVTKEQSARGPSENIVVSVLERRDQVPGARGGTRGRPFSPFEGRWTLLAKHRSGSLEAAVAAVRMRNLLLSSGILLLLTMSVGLIVVSSRRAQELARQQMEFVAAVSHELRTPVSVIGTAAANLADGVVGDPQRVRKYGETIQTEARRLAETVERVLQLAGIAAGRAAAAQSPVHPVDLVNDSIHACKTLIDSAGFEVVTDVPVDLPMVVGDVAALRSALQNLISNAVKYGGEARWIKVSALAGTGTPSTSLGAGRGAGTVVFSVEDRGLGIDAEDRKHIFEPFYRGREAVSKQIHGSGLGLNLVHRIAEAHGGRVSVSSEPGKGSVFSLTLPAVNEKAQATPVAVSTEAVARS